MKSAGRLKTTFLAVVAGLMLGLIPSVSLAEHGGGHASRGHAYASRGYVTRGYPASHRYYNGGYYGGHSYYGGHAYYGNYYGGRYCAPGVSFGFGLSWPYTGYYGYCNTYPSVRYYYPAPIYNSYGYVPSTYTVVPPAVTYAPVVASPSCNVPSASGYYYTSGQYYIGR